MNEQQIKSHTIYTALTDKRKFRVKISVNGMHLHNAVLLLTTNCTKKMVPITGRARSFLLFSEFSKKNREEGETE